MTHISYLVVTGLVLAAIPAVAQDPLRKVPGPVASFVQQFDQECKARGLGQAVVNENYRADNPGPKDVNGDGIPDYIIYKCMVGCSKTPFAFVGTGTPCPWGSLFLSTHDKYAKVFLPGKVSQIQAGPPIRISLQRPRELQVNGNYCRNPYPTFDPVQVYELKQERFQWVETCPANENCKLVKAAGL